MPAEHKLPEWVTKTMDEPEYLLFMACCCGDANTEEVKLTRDEFIALKRHLAKMRGFIVEEADPAAAAKIVISALVHSVTPDPAAPAKPVLQEDLEILSTLETETGNLRRELFRRVKAGDKIEDGPLTIRGGKVVPRTAAKPRKAA